MSIFAHAGYWTGDMTVELVATFPRLLRRAADGSHGPQLRRADMLKTPDEWLIYGPMMFAMSVVSLVAEHQCPSDALGGIVPGRSRFRMPVYAATTRFAHCLRDAVSRQYRQPALEVNAGFTDDLRHTINRSANPLPIELAEVTTLSALS
jgi:hypothetical protein